MSWHYRARKRVLQGEEFFDVVEFYESPEGWTCEGVGPSGDTLSELVQDVGRMYNDVQRYPVLIDEGKP